MANVHLLTEGLLGHHRSAITKCASTPYSSESVEETYLFRIIVLVLVLFIVIIVLVKPVTFFLPFLPLNSI
jgi:hypothetical protein